MKENDTKVGICAFPGTHFICWNAELREQRHSVLAETGAVQLACHH